MTAWEEKMEEGRGRRKGQRRGLDHDRYRNIKVSIQKKKSDKMPVIQCLISSEIRTHSLSVEMSQVECYVEMEKEEKMKEEREKRRKRGRSPDE